jgi:hypothetical protein
MIPPHEKSEILSTLRKVVQKVPRSRLIPELRTGSIMEDLDFDVTPIVYFGVFG